jgi:hypothetical protein
MGPKTTIQVKSSEHYDLYIQDEDFGFRPLIFKPLLQDIGQDNYFYFEFFPNYNNTTDVYELVELDDHYQFKIYDLQGAEVEQESGVRVYLRNDSGFHN